MQQVVVAVAVVTEVVGLIDNDKVVVFFLVVTVTIYNFIKASVGNKTAVLVLDAEISECLLPVALHRRREDDEDAGVVAISGDEPLGNHSGHHRFAQTHHVCDETTAVLHHDIIALHNSIALVGEVVVVVGKLWDEVVFHLVAEMIDKHPHIELVGCRLVVFGSEMGLPDNLVHIVQRHRNGIVP